MDVEEKSALIKVLKSHKRALAWKLFDIQGINPEFCTTSSFGSGILLLSAVSTSKEDPGLADTLCTMKGKGYDVVVNEEDDVDSNSFGYGWWKLYDMVGEADGSLYGRPFSVFGNTYQNCSQVVEPHASKVVKIPTEVYQIGRRVFYGQRGALSRPLDSKKGLSVDKPNSMSLQNDSSHHVKRN
ncbi:hypothetical protein Tco_0071524 [Tanacetum coccineum]